MPQAGTPGDDRSATGGWLAPLLVLMLGTFMGALDTSSVNVALPTIEHSLGISPDDGKWISTAYTLSMGVAIPLSKWLGERLGIARLYVFSLVAFTAGSALCGLAWDLTSIVAFRVLQAIPGGIMPVVGMTLLFMMVPKDKIGTAMGIFGVGVIVAPGVGPALGGWLVEYSTWQMLFLCKIPIGVLATVAARLILPGRKPASWSRFDPWGFAAIAVALFSLLLATSQGQEWGWTSYPTMILLTMSALSFGLFVIIERELDNPLLDLRVFKTWPFVNSMMIIFLITFAMFGTLFYIPQLLLGVMGLSPLNAGLAMMPTAAAMAVMMPVAGRLSDRFGPRLPAFSGMLVATFAFLHLAHITRDIPKDTVIIWASVFNLGLGLTMMPVISGGVAALAPKLVDSGSALNQVGLRSASALAVAALGALSTAQSAQMMADRGALLGLRPTLPQAVDAGAEEGAAGLYALYSLLKLEVTATAYANMFVLLAAMCALAGVLALFMPGRRPAVAISAGADTAVGGATATVDHAEAPAWSATLARRNGRPEPSSVEP